MSECKRPAVTPSDLSPVRQPRPELEARPPRIAKLPLDRRGYPVPWFVAWDKGEPEFRAMDPRKWRRAIKERLCWVCGEPLGVHLTFPIGPMCAINRTIAEPPSHHECAAWSARNCPFLSRPQMVRREDDIINNETLGATAAGVALTRNPGVTCLWTTRRFKVFRTEAGGGGNAGYLIELGEPEKVEWFARGRPATRDEVDASIASGIHLLEAACDQESSVSRMLDARAELARRRRAVSLLLPPATP